MSGEEKDESSASGRGPGLETTGAGQDDASAPRSEGRAPSPFAHPRFDPAEVFRRHHSALREGLEGHPYPGFLAGISHQGQFDATWIAASDGEVRAAIIGRHSRATLALPRDHASAALRHLALLVRTERDRPVARLLDLQTEIGFADPLGRRLEAVRTDGPTFLSAGGAVLILFPTGSSARLADDPEVAWKHVPPRRWLESRCGRRTPEEPPRLGAGPGGETLIRAEDGPRGARSRLCREEEIPVALATVASGADETHVRISGRAVDEGFLIGRYDRCEVGGPEADESLSRVHLLIVREGRRILAIDTASTNGTYVGEDRVHLTELVERTRLDLGGVLDITWRFCN